MVAHSLLLTVALGSLLAASHATASAAPAPRWPVRAAPSCEWAGFDDAVARFSRIIQVWAAFPGDPCSGALKRRAGLAACAAANG